MNVSNRLLLLLVLVPFLGILIACGGPLPPKSTNSPPSAERDYQPRFVIETGLMDPWDQKKTGPTHMAVSPDGKYLLTLAMSSKENVQVWDLATRKKLHAFRNDIGTMHAHIAIADDSRTAAYVQLRPTAGIVIFDLVTGETKQTITDKNGQYINSFSPWKSMHFAPGGGVLVYGGKHIVGWDTATGKMKFIWGGSSHCLTPFFDNGTKVANLQNGTIYIRETAKGKVLTSLDAGECRAIALTQDQQTLIAGTGGKVKCFDLPGGELRKEFKMEMGTYLHIVPFPDHRIAAWPTNNGFIICDIEAGTKKQQVKTNEPYLTGLALTPDGSTLLTAATDGTIKGWRVNAKGMVE
jgi:WD40 repeat protein